MTCEDVKISNTGEILTPTYNCDVVETNIKYSRKTGCEIQKETTNEPNITSSVITMKKAIKHSCETPQNKKHDSYERRLLKLKGKVLSCV
jgi:hypothetical protein